jgi:hypothetical protein
VKLASLLSEVLYFGHLIVGFADFIEQKWLFSTARLSCAPQIGLDIIETFMQLGRGFLQMNVFVFWKEPILVTF